MQNRARIFCAWTILIHCLLKVEFKSHHGPYLFPLDLCKGDILHFKISGLSSNQYLYWRSTMYVDLQIERIFCLSYFSERKKKEAVFIASFSLWASGAEVSPYILHLRTKEFILPSLNNLEWWATGRFSYIILLTTLSRQLF